MVRLLASSSLLLLVACAGADTSQTDDSGLAPGPTTDCDVLGLPSVPFQDAVASAKLYDVAADITLATTEGDWNLRENWWGCDVYLFIPEEPAQNQGAPDPTWSKKKDNKALIDTMPLNTHVFFLSSQRSDEDRLAALDELKSTIDPQLDEYDDETRAWKERHIHYVTDRDGKADSWLGDSLSSPGWGVGIDREQRVRYIGSMADPERYDSSYGWFDPNISLVANEARYYNYEAVRQAALDAEGATVVQAFTGEVISDGGWAGVTTSVDVVLPDAATMKTFDTLELDLTMLCEGDGEYTECPAWDYINSAYLCDADDDTVCTTELGRWITTYHREGRWVHDVSPLLALLKDGGTRRIAFYSQQPYQVTLSLRLSDQGLPDRPDEVRVLYTGGGVSSTYNDREAQEIDVPADVTRVGLGVVMSGHGNPGCFEFCGTEHNFTVNGNDNLFTYEITNQTYGCMDQVEDGTVPNQYGTWWYGRNGWCPGKQVNMDVVDVTDEVLFGQTNSFDYELTNLDGSLDSGGNIDLVTWLVFYRAK